MQDQPGKVYSSGDSVFCISNLLLHLCSMGRLFVSKGYKEKIPVYDGDMAALYYSFIYG